MSKLIISLIMNFGLQAILFDSYVYTPGKSNYLNLLKIVSITTLIIALFYYIIGIY